MPIPVLIRKFRPGYSAAECRLVAILPTLPSSHAPGLCCCLMGFQADEDHLTASREMYSRIMEITTPVPPGDDEQGLVLNRLHDQGYNVFTVYRVTAEMHRRRGAVPGSPGATIPNVEEETPEQTPVILRSHTSGFMAVFPTEARGVIPADCLILRGFDLSETLEESIADYSYAIAASRPVAPGPTADRILRRIREETSFNPVLISRATEAMGVARERNRREQAGEREEARQRAQGNNASASRRDVLAVTQTDAGRAEPPSPKMGIVFRGDKIVATDALGQGAILVGLSSNAETMGEMAVVRLSDGAKQPSIMLDSAPLSVCSSGSGGVISALTRSRVFRTVLLPRAEKSYPLSRMLTHRIEAGQTFCLGADGVLYSTDGVEDQRKEIANLGGAWNFSILRQGGDDLIDILFCGPEGLVGATRARINGGGGFGRNGSVAIPRWIRRVGENGIDSVLPIGFSDLMLISHWGGALGIRRISDGGSVCILAGHDATIRATAVSPNLGLCASGDIDGMICVWSINDQRLMGALEGHSGEISGLHFIPDQTTRSGYVLISASHDGTIRRWRFSVPSEYSPGKVTTSRATDKVNHRWLDL